MGSITITFAPGVRFGQNDSVQQTAAPHKVQDLISDRRGCSQAPGHLLRCWPWLLQLLCCLLCLSTSLHVIPSSLEKSAAPFFVCQSWNRSALAWSGSFYESQKGPGWGEQTSLAERGPRSFSFPTSHVLLHYEYGPYLSITCQKTNTSVRGSQKQSPRQMDSPHESELGRWLSG